MPTTQHAGQSVQRIGQSRAARWMRWQEGRWTFPKDQLNELAEHGIDPSRSTVANWRNGVIPESDTLIRLIELFPSLKHLFWPEHQMVRAETILRDLDELDALDAMLSAKLRALRDAL